MAISIGKDAPRIEIGGKAYALRMSDHDILRLCREAQRRALNIHIGAEDEALAFLTWAASRLDDMLGGGAAHEIFGDAPVDLAGMIGLYSAIAAERSRVHRQYIRDRYGV